MAISNIFALLTSTCRSTTIQRWKHGCVSLATAVTWTRRMLKFDLNCLILNITREGVNFHIAVGSVQFFINISVGQQDFHIENKLRNNMCRHIVSPLTQRYKHFAVTHSLILPITHTNTEKNYVFVKYLRVQFRQFNLVTKTCALKICHPGCDSGISTGKRFTSFRVNTLCPSSDSVGPSPRILAIETSTWQDFYSACLA
jgi:hypothetical protein